MAGMVNMEKVNEKEKEEKLPTPPSDVTDLVEDDANDMAPVDQIIKADAGESQDTETTMNAAPRGMKILGGFRGGMAHGTESEVGEKTIEKGSSAQVKEERNETIEFEVKYVDNGEKEIELVLDLDKFKGYAPHCHNCNHLATKLILRRTNQNQTKKYWFVIWFEYFVVLIWGKPAGSGTSKKGGKDLLPTINLPDKNGNNDPKRDHTGKIANDIKHKEGGKVDQLPSIDQQDKIEDEPYSDIIKHENDGKNKEEGVNGQLSPADRPHKIENEEFQKKKKKVQKKKKNWRSISESSDRESDTEDEEEEEEAKPKIVDLFINLGHLNIVEILKCIVYGGLIESITSLSVVASGAATDASTLNVFAIGLALLFSGLIAIGSKLADLKRGKNKHYKEQLGGSKEEFVFHSTLVVLSYLVFGLVAPSTFAFTFVDKYAKILAAAAAGFFCIFILTIAKVYTTSKDKHLFRSYVEPTRNYLIISFVTSGIAYAVGYSIEMYVLKLGLFTSVERVSCYHGEAY